MSEIKNEREEKRKNKKNVNKVLSIIIAVIIWFYAVQQTNPVISKTFADVPVTLTNVELLAERGLAISGQEPYNIDLMVEGKKQSLVKITAQDMVVTLNVADLKKGENYVTVKVSTPDAAKLLETKPTQLNINVEELVTQEKNVKAVFTGSLKDGAEPGGVETLPDTIEVTGAKSAVKSVAYVAATVDVKNLSNESKELTVHVTPVDNDGNPVANVTLAQTTVQVTASKYQTKEVPLQVSVSGSVKDIYEVTSQEVPDTIKIKGPAAALESIKSVSAMPVDISQVVSSTAIEVKPILPEGVEAAAGYEHLKVTLTVTPIATKSFGFTGDEVRIDDLKDGLKGFVENQEFTVTVWGNENVLKTLTKADLALVVNLSSVTTQEDGTLTLGQEVVDGVLQVQCSKAIQKSSVSPANASVRIEAVAPAMVQGQ